MADEQQTNPHQEWPQPPPAEQQAQPQAQPQKSVRWQRRQERLAKVRSQQAVPRVRVTPRDEKIRRNIKHPAGGIGFRAKGSVEWPYDQFTKRRVRDGDITIEERKPATPSPNRRPRLD
jgi:hypothetical protein